ncbi:MAG: hypothetical protein ACRDPV_06920, partial [Gaiellaceae bacterium]
ADERVVMERGAVEGEVFHRSAVAELAPVPMRPALGSHLATLVRKELIRPDKPQLAGEDGFRFRHLLIRDAAYDALPKAVRAELHQRFAAWLEERDAGLVERDEILGYHLEQARRYRAELGADDSALSALSGRAADHLAGAGRGALDRGDFNAGRGLLRRATAVLPPGDERRLALAPDLCDALWEAGDTTAIMSVLAEARQTTDAVLRAIVAILETEPQLGATGRSTPDERREKHDRARSVLEAAGHDEGLSLYWWSVGHDAWYRCRAEETAAACELALVHAERAGSKRLARDAAHWMAGSCVFGPTPVVEAIERVEGIRARSERSILSEAHSSIFLGMLAAMQGDAVRGLALVRDAGETFRGAGLVVTAAGHSMGEAWAAFWAGDLAAAERALRSGLEVLERLDDRGYHPTIALQLAWLMYHESRYDEVETLCATGRAYTTTEDLVNFVYLDMIEGCLCARRGQHAEAEERVRRALALAETTDFYWCRGTARLFLSEALALAGRMGEASEEAAVGLAHYDAKGDVSSAALARERLDELGVAYA